MKKHFFTSVLLTSIVILFTMYGCRKLIYAQTTEQLLTGKWVMKTAIGNYTVMGENKKDTTSFTSADYFDFKADGTLSISATNVNYNGKWRVANNKLFITETNYIDYAAGFNLPVLTANTLQLYYTESTPAFLEQQLNFSR